MSENNNDFSAAIIGGISGALVAFILFVYLPMKRNHDQCGRITLCVPAKQAQP